MTSNRSAFGVVARALTLAVLAAGCSAAHGDDDGHAWWTHVQVLAADSLRGRMTGTDDYLKSARYVVQQLRAEGVEPLGNPNAVPSSDEAWFQQVSFVRCTIREPECALSLVRNGVVTPLELGPDAILGVGIDVPDSLEAPMVFVGYGLSVPEVGYDDLKGLDLRGKVAVYVRSGPDTLPPTLRAHAQSTDVRWAALRAAGAIGIASVRLSGNVDYPWERAMRSRLDPDLSLDDPVLDTTPGLELAVRINPKRFDLFLAGSGHTAEEILALADSGKRIPAFPLVGRVRARARYEHAKVMSPNVVGLIRGSDPKLRDEYVVVSAHLDHLGVGSPVRGDTIYNGAMDNGSGVASLIEFARYARRTPNPFRRSVILLAVTGEEEGMLGSRWYAARPTVPPSALVADVNLDMFLPIVKMTAITVYGLEESDLGDRFTAMAKAAGVEAVDDPEPQRNIFIRSDQISFIRHGVPSLFFEIGNIPGDTTTAGILRRWVRRRYHSPSDDVDQPILLDEAARFTHLLYDFTRDVANRDERPQWKADSFFRRFATGQGTGGAAAAGR